MGRIGLYLHHNPHGALCRAAHHEAAACISAGCLDVKVAKDAIWDAVFATPSRHIKQYTPRGFVGWQFERGERQEPTTLKITWSTRTERGRHARGGSGDRSDKDSDLSRHDVLFFGPAKL